MDWEMAGWQLLHLCIAPRRVSVPVLALDSVELIVSAGIATCEQIRTDPWTGAHAVSGRYYHKQTKNTWARDDPAILVLMAGFLSAAALLWTALYLRSWDPLKWFSVAFWMIARDFVLSGLVISTVLWCAVLFRPDEDD